MKLKTLLAIKQYIGNGKTCEELFKTADLRYYWKYYKEGKFYFDKLTNQHRCK